MRTISFIVTARDEAPHIVRRTVDELRSTTPSAGREIILVDDGSTIPVAGMPHEVKVLRNDEPVGVSQARRQAFMQAAGDVLVCLDAHMTFDRDWLDYMLDHVDSGALLCSAFCDYERSICHCFGADFEWCGQRNYYEQLSPGFRLRHRVEVPGAQAVEVPMLIGACYMMLRSTYDSLGGWSPLFRVWGADEQDLSARAWIAEFGVKCITGARVGHLWRPAFPYPVSYEHLEFNQLALIRTVFDTRTIRMLEVFFEPLPPRVRDWLDGGEIAKWRAVVQKARRCDDKDFFLRFVPELHHLGVRFNDGERV